MCLFLCMHLMNCFCNARAIGERSGLIYEVRIIARVEGSCSRKGNSPGRPSKGKGATVARGKRRSPSDTKP